MFANNPARTNVENRVTYRRGLITALDIGSSKIACLIGEADSKSLRVVGAALRESRGVRRGAIVDLDIAEQAIRETVAAAEAQADARIDRVVISVNCGQPINLTATASSLMSGNLIEDRHLSAAIRQTSNKLEIEGHTVIQRTVTSYSLDNVQRVTGPLGMVCDQLSVTMSGLAVKKAPFANLALAVERSGLCVCGTLFASYASALAVLNDDEKHVGAIVIDMGSGVTSISVFRDGQLIHADWVPWGGGMVTADLASVLGMSISEAERTKTLHGAAVSGPGTGSDMFNIPHISGDTDGNVSVPGALISQIIQSRLEEIFGEVSRRLEKAGLEISAATNCVLTGGGCQLPRTSELAARVLGWKVRMGQSLGLVGMPQQALRSEYATAIGLLLAGATTPPELLNVDRYGDWTPPLEQSPIKTILANFFGFSARK